MFDIGWQEIFVLAVLSIIVIGPKDLPKAIKTISRLIRKARGMARDLQGGFDEIVREVELDDLKREAEKIATIDYTKELQDTVDPEGKLAAEVEDMMDMDIVGETVNNIEDEFKIMPPSDSETTEPEPKTEKPAQTAKSS